jgi:hypothetical protein
MDNHNMTNEEYHLRVYSIRKQLFERCLPVVKHYHFDLVHDMDLIEAYPGVPFVHMVNDYGTHMKLLLPADHPDWPSKGQQARYLFGKATRSYMLTNSLEAVRSWHHQHEQSTHMYHHFDGNNLHYVTWKHVLAIVDQYETAIKTTWSKE